MDEQGEKKTRAGIISTLFGAYGQSNDTNRVKIYLKATSDIPEKLLGAACKKLLLESKFLPSIAEIVEAARTVAGEIDETSRIKPWDEAWGEIEKAMYATPWGKTPKFSTLEITIAVNRFGWRTLQETLADDMPTVRAQVRRMYDDVCRYSKEHGISQYVLGGKREELLTPGRTSGLTAIGDVMAMLGGGGRG